MFDVRFLNRLRLAELDAVAPELQGAAHILEFGAGTGQQALLLTERGFKVTAIDLASSAYADARMFPITEYDGHALPLADGSIDLIFSSNVLEHVENLDEISREFRRVLKPGGRCVHVLPSVPWRAWTLLSGFPAAVAWTAALMGNLVAPRDGRRTPLHHVKMIVGSLLPLGHGVAFEAFSELWTFSAAAWRRRFTRQGFRVESVRPTGLFHTGHMLFGPGLNIPARERLARRLGSAANVFVLRPAAG